jgi:hypothetical protein
MYMNCYKSDHRIPFWSVWLENADKPERSPVRRVRHIIAVVSAQQDTVPAWYNTTPRLQPCCIRDAQILYTKSFAYDYYIKDVASEA